MNGRQCSAMALALVAATRAGQSPAVQAAQDAAYYHGEISIPKLTVCSHVTYRRSGRGAPDPGNGGVPSVPRVNPVEMAGRLTQTSAATPSPSLALPEGKGKALVERVCGGCHDPSLVMFTREDEEGWTVIVQDMAARGARGTQEELNIIAGYLAENFSRKSGFTPLLLRDAGAAAGAADDQQRFTAGREIYRSLCVVCHQATGQGREHVAPSLVQSQLVLGPVGIPIRIMLHGKRGPTNVMPALGRFMTDDQIAATLTYIRREWGHTASAIDAAAVKEVRMLTSGRARPWTAEELRQAVPGGNEATAFPGGILRRSDHRK